MIKSQVYMYIHILIGFTFWRACYRSYRIGIYTHIILLRRILEICNICSVTILMQESNERVIKCNWGKITQKCEMWAILVLHAICICVRITPTAKWRCYSMGLRWCRTITWNHRRRKNIPLNILYYFRKSLMLSTI